MYFFKYNQMGNDFVILDDRKEKLSNLEKKKFQFLANRKFGIGADGIVLLQNSKTCDYRFRIFNSDGSEAQSCGNGLCCFTHFLKEMGLITSSVRIELMDSQVESKIEDEKVILSMSSPKDIKLNQQFILNARKTTCHHVNTGVPHLVTFVDDLDGIDFELGKKMRSFYNANVNFVQRPLQGKTFNQVRARVYERGVEQETLGCGTGAVACALIAMKEYSIQGPVSISYPGGSVNISICSSRVSLSGVPQKVFTGNINL